MVLYLYLFIHIFELLFILLLLLLFVVVCIFFIFSLENMKCFVWLLCIFICSQQVLLLVPFWHVLLWVLHRVCWPCQRARKSIYVWAGHAVNNFGIVSVSTVPCTSKPQLRDSLPCLLLSVVLLLSGPLQFTPLLSSLLQSVHYYFVCLNSVCYSPFSVSPVCFILVYPSAFLGT